ncbi:hypothetical protein [Micromonospora sp. NPDC049645]|uniref:hypothetical protein n=1 Tax=Micromonospora sp. NPDC049645 TaxID=3155508 RepID=UPI00343DCE44
MAAGLYVLSVVLQDPPVVLGMVVSFALDVPWDADLIGERPIWPDGAVEDPEYEGPWVVVLSERARDAVAEIPNLITLGRRAQAADGAEAEGQAAVGFRTWEPGGDAGQSQASVERHPPVSVLRKACFISRSEPSVMIVMVRTAWKRTASLS